MGLSSAATRWLLVLLAVWDEVVARSSGAEDALPQPGRRNADHVFLGNGRLTALLENPAPAPAAAPGPAPGPMASPAPGPGGPTPVPMEVWAGYGRFFSRAYFERWGHWSVSPAALAALSTPPPCEQSPIGIAADAMANPLPTAPGGPSSENEVTPCKAPEAGSSSGEVANPCAGG
eukprot:TRINITY_DN111968_c0_g1_i1.p1 TRINITY_DN111968_c0_g1~~TRINITY_DN111968_c0_g1_i1.p1  ORF type:complete len:176 (-),score=27.40 TRINITY_DN111968_c0_g1_i1:107-634(-)